MDWTGHAPGRWFFIAHGPLRDALTRQADVLSTWAESGSCSEANCLTFLRSISQTL
jgi:hypothetical protein